MQLLTIPQSPSPSCVRRTFTGGLLCESFGKLEGSELGRVRRSYMQPGAPLLVRGLDMAQLARDVNQMTSEPPAALGGIPFDAGEELRDLVYVDVDQDPGLANYTAAVAAAAAPPAKTVVLRNWTGLPQTFLPAQGGPSPAVEYLSLHCTQLDHLPDSVSQLASLQYLSLTVQQPNPRQFTALPANFSALTTLRRLEMRGCSALTGLQQLSALGCLTRLVVHDCTSLTFPPDSSIAGLTSLVWLTLTGAKSVTDLPTDLGELAALKVLQLDGCRALRTLPPSFASLRPHTLTLDGAQTLEAIPPAFFGAAKPLNALVLRGCAALKQLPNEITALTNLGLLDVRGCTGLQPLPDGLGRSLKDELRVDHGVMEGWEVVKRLRARRVRVVATKSGVDV
jgi:hypothetical protein